jgi:predicted Ser/Thr protein kinase
MHLTIGGTEIVPCALTQHLILLLVERDAELKKARTGSVECHWHENADEVTIQVRKHQRSRSAIDAKARILNRLAGA